MKKLLVTFFIAITLTTALFPAKSYAWKPGPEYGKDLPTFTEIYNRFVAANHRDPYDSGELSRWNQAEATKTNKANIAAAEAHDAACSGLNFLTFNCWTTLFYDIVDIVGNMVLSAGAWILWLCGVAFNLSMVEFVVQMKTRVGEIQAIYVVWQTVRDVANMFFIFILLVIAIQTILDVGYNYVKVLRNVILVALFINFSFFATGVMIDASNIIALQFYNGFASENCNSGGTGSSALNTWANTKDGCMSQTVVNSMRLATVYNVNTNTSGNIALSSSDGGIAFLVTVIMGSALMVIAGGVFLASAIMIFYRFVILIFALMLSPLAFAALALPGAKKYWNKWWTALTEQLIFAPVYFMFLWIVMKIIRSNVIHPSGSFTSGFKGNGQELFGLISGFTIIIILLIYSLTLAKELGAGGTTLAGKVSGKFQDFARRSTIGLATRGAQSFGRNTAGRLASRIASSETMKGWAANSKFGVSRLAQKGLTSVAGASFGGKKGGFDQAEKDYVKKQEEFAKTLGPNPLVIKSAEAELKQAREERNTAIEEVSKPFVQKEAEKKVVKTDLEQKIKDDKEKMERLPKTKFDPDSEAGKKQKALEDAILTRLVENQEKLAGLEASMEKDSKEKVEVANRAGSEFKERVDSAQEKVNKVKGISNMKEATEQAEKLGFKGDELKKKAEELMKTYKGIAKERQEIFATNIENRWFTGPYKKAAASSAVRKNVIGGKPEVEKLYEEIVKKINEGKTEGGVEGEEKGKDKQPTADSTKEPKTS